METLAKAATSPMVGTARRFSPPPAPSLSWGPPSFSGLDRYIVLYCASSLPGRPIWGLSL